MDHQIQSPSDLQHSLRESFFLDLSPNTVGRDWKGLLVINVSVLASSEVIPTVMHVPSPRRIQFYLSQTMGFLHSGKTTPQLNGWSLSLSVLASEAILPNGRSNTQTQDGGEGKGDGEK